MVQSAKRSDGKNLKCAPTRLHVKKKENKTSTATFSLRCSVRIFGGLYCCMCERSEMWRPCHHVDLTTSSLHQSGEARPFFVDGPSPYLPAKQVYAEQRQLEHTLLLEDLPLRAQSGRPNLQWNLTHRLPRAAWTLLLWRY